MPNIHTGLIRHAFHIMKGDVASNLHIGPLRLPRASVRKTMEMAREIGLLSKKQRTLVLFQW